MRAAAFGRGRNGRGRGKEGELEETEQGHKSRERKGHSKWMKINKYGVKYKESWPEER